MSPNKFIILIRFVILSSASILGLTACSGGSGEGAAGDAPNTSNLAAAALAIVTLDPRIGYPLTVSVSIDAVEVTNNVGVALFAIDKVRVPQRQLPLGTAVITQVAAGSNSYEVEVNIPSSVEFAGPYHIGAVVDAANTIAETDEEDNDTSTETMLSIDPVPNLFVEFLESDKSAVELEDKKYVDQVQLGVVNSDAGGTLTWGYKALKYPSM